MKVLNTLKLLGIAASIVFATNASAITTTVPSINGSPIIFTGHGAGYFNWDGYRIGFTGFGTSGGTWFRVPAVPEADTWAMMAVGLGLVGLRLRRKSKNAA